MKKFKAESQRLLEMMINSVYTHKDVFLRELISNAADAIDKQYYKSLDGGSTGMSRDEYKINVVADKEARTLTVSDNGCGMNEEEMDKNLGTIAHSGTDEFRKSTDNTTEVIGMFGVGFYSAFMVADKVEVLSRPYGSETAYLWESDGVSGYTISSAEKEDYGTKITLHIKADADEERYSEFLEDYTLKSLIKKHSDYIRYPIMLSIVGEKHEQDHDEKCDCDECKEKAPEQINSMVPLWKKPRAEVTDDEINNFYTDAFHDFDKPLEVAYVSAEGTVSFKAMLFIPSRAAYDYYTKDFEKGLKLYSNGVMIMEKCADLLEDSFSFVRGVVDSQDLSLNLSRETLQHNKQVKSMASAISKKLRATLEEMLKNDKEKYEKFFDVFGMQLKYGIYSTYGMKKDELQDLLIFRHTAGEDRITFKQYVENLKEGQERIYYACGGSLESIKGLPQLEALTDKGYDVLALTDGIDEFLMKMLINYDGHDFKSVADEDAAPSEIVEVDDDRKQMLAFVKNALEGKVKDVRVSKRLKKHAVCLSAEGELSIEMEKVLNSIPNPNNNKVNAEKVLEINANHPLFDKMYKLFESDKESLTKLADVLYQQARLIEGLTIDNPAQFSENSCYLLSK